MERTAEEWGRVAVALPGWRWIPGMRSGYAGKGGRVRGVSGDGEWVESFRDDARGLWVDQVDDAWPDPDDPATAGCLLALLGRAVRVVSEDTTCAPDWYYRAHVPFHLSHDGRGYGIAEPTLGRACIAAAEALGRWPGGGQ